MIGATTRHLAIGKSSSTSVRGTWMRGGTSKCWIFDSTVLPETNEARAAILLDAFGSPDPNQINGVGGGTSTTSKAIIVEGHDATKREVVYSFAQVSIDDQSVEWISNCGNCATGVALYAVEEGLVEVTDPVTSLTLINRGTGLVLELEVSTTDSAYGDRSRPGEYSGVAVDLTFRCESWTSFGSLLPTGRSTDVLIVDDRPYVATLIDAGAPAVLVRAADVGLHAAASSDALLALMPLFASIRRTAGAMMGLPVDGQSIPKVGVVGVPAKGAPADLSARMISMTAPHPSIGLTSAVAVAVASQVVGSIPHAALVLDPADPHSAGSDGRRRLRIDTLGGIVEMNLDLPGPTAVRFRRSARRLVDGAVYLSAKTATNTRARSDHVR
jgi:2-methylaconitate cis-trans-isomerase PrpF